MSREIITLQLGHYANFVGAHWWNIQESSFDYGDQKSGHSGEETDHDVLFREGMTERGEVTFTPRLVLAELKGGLGTLKSSGVLYDDDENGLETSVWNGDTCVYEQTPENKNKFLKELDESPSHENGVMDTATPPNGARRSTSYCLEKDVKVWSDFLRVHFHPKSVVLINEHFHTSENDPFDLWSKGMSLKNCVEELEERVRFYAEECDFMQGFHILADSHNGFSGLASTVTQYLHDEFPSKRLVSFPVSPAEFPNDSYIKSLKRNLSNSLFLPALSENSSLVCPLSLNSGFRSKSRTFPHLIYDASLNYHTSAIIASALDTITLNHRLKGSLGINLDEFCSEVTSASKVLTSLALSMPINLHSASAHHDLLTDPSKFYDGIFEDSQWAYVSPHVGDAAIVSEYYSQCTTMRGLKTALSVNSVFCESKDSLASVEALKQYLDNTYRGSHNSCHIRYSPMKTSIPYPQFFRQTVNHDGLILNPENSVNRHATKIFEAFSLPSPRWINCMNEEHKPVANGHAIANGNSVFSRKDVQSVSLLTNLQCSSAVANVLKYAVGCLQQSSKKNFSFHGIETENLESEIEMLKSLQDEYEVKQMSSDSDGDF